MNHEHANCAERTFSNQEKLHAAMRELQMREHLYPAFIARGKLTEYQARYEIAVMRAIVADYQALTTAERLL